LQRLELKSAIFQSIFISATEHLTHYWQRGEFDLALLACQKRESTSMTLEPHDAEGLSEKIRIVCCKLRKMTEAKEPGII